LFYFQNPSTFFFESAGHLHSTPAFGSRSVPVPRAFEKKGAWVLKIKNRFCFSKLFFQVPTFRKKNFLKKPKKKKKKLLSSKRFFLNLTCYRKNRFQVLYRTSKVFFDKMESPKKTSRTIKFFF